MSPKELSTLFEAARETFEVEKGQPTDTYLVKIRAVITTILLLSPYNAKKEDHNLVRLVWSTYTYMATHGVVAFSIPTRPAIYDSSITDDNKTSIVRKKEIIWRVCVEDCKIFDKANLKARAFILHAAEETWVLELKDEETLFTLVSTKQLLTHLHTICCSLHAINVLDMQNEMQEYQVDRYGILEYINALEVVQKKLKQEMGKIPSRTGPFFLFQRKQY